MLARRDFVVGRLDVESHRFEREDDLAADVFALIDGAEVEVAGRVVRLGRRHAVLRLKRKNSASGPAFIVKPLAAASAITFFRQARGSPMNGWPSGV